MKSLLVGLFVLLCVKATAQSPYLSILVKMDSAKAEFTRYKIEMKICEPKKMSTKPGWFTHDTSTINFASLKATDITCWKYSEKGSPERISGQEEEKPINQFEFGNQIFAWENIFIFRISNQSSRGWWPSMYIVIPVKYKSFRTRIDITDVEFQSGKVIFLTDANAWYDEKKLNIRQSLKNEKGTEVKDFLLREILESE